MRNLAMVLVGLSALGFILAVISALIVGSPIMGISPEGFSRACTNLALIAIALIVCSKDGAKAD